MLTLRILIALLNEAKCMPLVRAISTSVVLNSNVVILYDHTVCALLQCSIGGGHGVLLGEGFKVLWYDDCIAG